MAGSAMVSAAAGELRAPTVLSKKRPGEAVSMEFGATEMRLETSALTIRLLTIAGPDSWSVVGGARAPP